MPPFLRIRVQLALLAMAMAAAPCSCPADSLEDDLTFAMYAGGLEGFVEEPNFPLVDTGIQQCHQHMFAPNEQPGFGNQDQSFLSPNEGHHMSMANQNAFLFNPTCPLQDHSAVSHEIANPNLSSGQGCSADHNVNAASHVGRCHAGHPFLIDESSQVHQSGQNKVMSLQGHGFGHNTQPVSESDTFHEIFEVIDSPGFANLDPNQIQHNELVGQKQHLNPVTSHENVQGMDSTILSLPEIPQGNSGNNEFIQSQDQLVPIEGFPLPETPNEQMTPTASPCASAGHEIGQVSPERSAADIGRVITPMQTSNAHIFGDNFSNTALETPIHRENLQSMETPSFQNTHHCINCNGDVAINSQENLKMDLLSNPSDSQTFIRNPSIEQGEQRNVFQQQSLTSPSIISSVRPPITTGHEHISQRTDEQQLQTTNFGNIQPLDHHQKNQNSVETQHSIQHQDGLHEGPNIVQIQPLVNQAVVQESSKSVQIQPLVHNQASVQERPNNVQIQPLVNQAVVQESPKYVRIQTLVPHQARVQERPNNVQIQPLVPHQASVQERPNNVQIQPLVNQAVVQESPKYVQIQPLVPHQASVQERPNNVQIQPLGHHSPGFQKSPNSAQNHPLVQNQAGDQESKRNTRIQLLAPHHQASVQEIPKNVHTQPLHHQTSVQEIPESTKTRPLFHHQASAQPISVSVIQPELKNYFKNDFRQYQSIQGGYSSFEKDANLPSTVNPVLGTQKKVMAYRHLSQNNVQEPTSIMSNSYVPKPTVANISPPPQRPFQTQNNPFHNIVHQEEFILPPTLSEIPYDTFPYTESTDVEDKPDDKKQSPDDSSDCSDSKNSARCTAKNATKTFDDAKTNVTDTDRTEKTSDIVLVVPRVMKDITIANVTVNEKQSKLKKKARHFEVAENNRTTTVKKDGVVTTVSRLGDSGSAVQVCRCEVGKGCSCRSCQSCRACVKNVKNLCQTVGLRVAEDVGKFVKKEAASALKAIRDLKISA